MSVRKQDAYRALELLEEYYNRLESPEDKPLRDAIDRVIKVFKSRLFQALIDIQEFYETILLDDQNDRHAKMAATHNLADEWERQPMLKRDIHNGTSTKNEFSTVSTITTENPLSRPTNNKENIKRQPTPTPFSQIQQEPDSTHHQNTSEVHPYNDLTQFNYDDHWKEIKIDLHRPPGGGLGFSIAGGRDTPCINNSGAVVVTRITEGGLADQDGRLKLHDIILRVNDTDYTNIDHQPAVNYLKATENTVDLIVRRLEPPSMEEIILERPLNVNLGFSIAGGITHEHVKGDHGLFIIKVVPGGIADKNGRLRMGDRLMHVQSTKNNYDLRFVEHKNAVECIRRACEEGQKLTLIVGHPNNYSSNTHIQPVNSPNQNQQISTNQTNGHRSPNHEEHGESSGERRILLRRGQNGLGFNILGDDGALGVFVSVIHSDGAADKSGELRVGDRILAVNNVDLRNASYHDAASVLKNCGDTANLLVINKYEDFVCFQARNEEKRKRITTEPTGGTSNLRTSAKKQFLVRAEFNYDPAQDPSLPTGPGLSFRIGDILHVTNAADDSWWQAKRIINGVEEEEIGIIPSKSRIEKKERAKQKRVIFNNQGSSSRSSTVDRDKKKKKKFSIFNISGDKNVQSGDDTDNELENSDYVPSYELVVHQDIDYARPVIIFGPFKEIINDQLLNDHPEKFANCVPHTSRPKREKEVDGRDYHFVQSREQMERDIQNYLFIEVGEYGGNLYGTSINAVKNVANSSKHCLLDVSGHAIRRLMVGGLSPIVIYVKAPDVKWILENMGGEADEERAKQTYEKNLKIEEQFGELFTVTVTGESLSDVYDRVGEIIDQEQTVGHAWLPSKEKL